MRGAANAAAAPMLAFSRSRLRIGVASLCDSFGGNVAQWTSGCRSFNDANSADYGILAFVFDRERRIAVDASSGIGARFPCRLSQPVDGALARRFGRIDAVVTVSPGYPALAAVSWHADGCFTHHLHEARCEVRAGVSRCALR